MLTSLKKAGPKHHLERHHPSPVCSQSGRLMMHAADRRLYQTGPNPSSSFHPARFCLTQRKRCHLPTRRYVCVSARRQEPSDLFDRRSDGAGVFPSLVGGPERRAKARRMKAAAKSIRLDPGPRLSQSTPRHLAFALIGRDSSPSRPFPPSPVTDGGALTTWFFPL